MNRRNCHEACRRARAHDAVADVAWGDPIVVTNQSGVSQIEIGGIRQVENVDAQTDGRVSVSALWGTRQTPEARTAARSAADEIAVNSRLDDKLLFTQTDFSLVLSQANYALTAAADNLFVNEATVDFLLPFAYLEVTTNAEIPFVTLDTFLIADLRVCFAVACTLDDTVFNIHASLDASYRSFNWSVEAEGDPGLDLDPLRNPTIVDNGAGAGFLRTTRVEFAAFQGRVSLGNIPRGSPLTVEYVMQTRVSGLGGGSIAIAAINDPFVLDTDPVQKGTPLSVTLRPVGPPAPVPEPASAVFCVTALSAWLGRSVVRRRKRRP